MMRIVAHAVMMIGIVAVAGCGGSAAPAPLVIGHVANLSSGDARAGKKAELGIRLALEQLGPAASDQLAHRPIVVRHVDSGASLDTTEGAAARLVTVNHAVAMIGGLTRDEALRLDRSHVPVLAPLGLRSAAMSDLLFTTGVTPTQQGDALARFLAKDEFLPLMLVVDRRHEHAALAAEAFRKAWSDASSKLATSPNFIERGFSDKASEVAAALDEKEPKTVVFVGDADDLRALRREVKKPASTWAFLGEDGTYHRLEP